MSKCIHKQTAKLETFLVDRVKLFHFKWTNIILNFGLDSGQIITVYAKTTTKDFY